MITTEQQEINFERIAAAIAYIRTHFKKQPSLDEVAAEVNMSPAHFQKMFTDWAGTSPKKFLKYVSIEHAKRILQRSAQTTLFDAAWETGLSSTSRLHDLFMSVEGMTPAEYKNGGESLQIRYGFDPTPFGQVIVASTGRGICHIAFGSSRQKLSDDLKNRFPNARFTEEQDEAQIAALRFFERDWSELPQLKLHLKGTDFQLKVWESLLKIPVGGLTTYGEIARNIGVPNGSRAVGTAVGSNPVAFLIPCHRVIRSTGVAGEYMWGAGRKAAMIGWEGACMNG